MQIKRDYSRSFFGTRRRRLPLRNLLLTLLLLACLLALAWTRRDNLQFFALDLVGLAPTPTPFRQRTGHPRRRARAGLAIWPPPPRSFSARCNNDRTVSTISTNTASC